MTAPPETMQIPPSDIKSSIRGGYDFAAARYAEYADPLVFSFVVEPLVEAVRCLGRQVLDVASGSGALARRLDGCVAVDLSSDQLHENPNGQKVQADAESLPFRDNSFAVAACAFGINHFPHPEAAVREMARVARVVGLITWRRPEVPFRPKEIVRQVIARYENGYLLSRRSAVDGMSEAVGSEKAINRRLRDSGLDAAVRTVAVEVPWPGAEEFVEYRLSLPTGFSGGNHPAIKRDAVALISDLDSESLRWRPRLIVALGRRSSP